MSYAEPEAAVAAASSLHGIMIDDRKLKVQLKADQGDGRGPRGHDDGGHEQYDNAQ